MAKTIVIRRQRLGYSRTRILETIREATLYKHYKSIADYMMQVYAARWFSEDGLGTVYQDGTGYYFVSEVGR